MNYTVFSGSVVRICLWIMLILAPMGCGSGGGGFLGETPIPSGSDAVIVPPVADAGADQNVASNSMVSLDGRNSYSKSSGALTYLWQFVTVPAASSAVLSNATAAQPTFLADRVGTYTVNLVVSDGVSESKADSVEITAVNSSPYAYAGPDQTAEVGDLVKLDGSGSRDPNGDSISYSWHMTAPKNSSAALSDERAVNPTFIPDVSGVYVIGLSVSDGTLTMTDNMQVTVSLTAVANARPDQYLTSGPSTTITLDGRASYDADGHPMTSLQGSTPDMVPPIVSLVNVQQAADSTVLTQLTVIPAVGNTTGDDTWVWAAYNDKLFTLKKEIALPWVLINNS